ncbi:hypothetical protein HELRODRAFT_175664 [Helobdella robusta]|uniref:Uncharacterized protein n=1 Tax=Helobdella robusta TaxID=6412 RepID=T1F9H6_HELRO|nr:hypothetical protein HELRODRAFT_175664 [Helobdella robusta]ESO00680.1 hypothetical protein HELRODRAFT_175664 [Helobdella robusta]
MKNGRNCAQNRLSSDSTLTEHLLQNYDNHSFIWEKQPTFSEFLNRIKLKYPDKCYFQARQFSLSFLSSLLTSTKRSLTFNIDKCILLPHMINLNVFVMQFLKFSLQNSCNNILNHDPIRLESFHFFDKNECQFLENSEKWWSSDKSMRFPMYGLLFQHSVLLEVPSEAFNKKVSMKLRRKSEKVALDSLFLTKLSLSDDVNKMAGDENDLCDGSGAKLIEETDLSMLDVVKDVPLKSWFRIYKCIYGILDMLGWLYSVMVKMPALSSCSCSDVVRMQNDSRLPTQMISALILTHACLNALSCKLFGMPLRRT